MLDNYYDSYGYKAPEHFITTADLKKVKFAPATRVERHLTEVQSFFSETGQETGALSQSPLLMKPIPEPPINYKKKYLTFEALEDGVFTLAIGSEVSTDRLASVSYSLDNGETWVDTNNVDGKTVTITTDEVPAGDKVLWKGNGVAMANDDINFDTTASNRLKLVSNFSSTGKYNISGNIMSLLYGDDFKANDEFKEGSTCNFSLLFYSNPATDKLISARNLIFPSKKCPDFAYLRLFQGNTNLEHSPMILSDYVGVYGCGNLFYKCSSLIDTPKVLASNLVGANCYIYAFYGCSSLTKPPKLPATNLTDYCYQGLFYQCTSLITAPELPATTLTNSCYYGMFMLCESLEKTPELPATTLAEKCYLQMFQGCISLTNTTQLPATELIKECYSRMFESCTSLAVAPGLSATTLANSCYFNMFRDCKSLIVPPKLLAITLSELCYREMFYGCTSLTTAPELPATTLAEGCYIYMFSGCTSLTVAPELPATTLANNCYQDMFGGCTSLVEAPELPATELIKECYLRMFNGCSSLNYIKCSATNMSASNATKYWTLNVSPTGTFVKKAGVEWPSGANGIPTGWTVEEMSN